MCHAMKKFRHGGSVTSTTSSSYLVVGGGTTRRSGNYSRLTGIIYYSTSY